MGKKLKLDAGEISTFRLYRFYTLQNIVYQAIEKSGFFLSPGMPYCKFLFCKARIQAV